MTLPTAKPNSETLAATPRAVKAAYDLAAQKARRCQLAYPFRGLRQDHLKGGYSAMVPHSRVQNTQNWQWPTLT
ncbi:hypothetical protein BZL31_16485 [Escherichia coli]|nr:hypothetical protein BZL31_16485 [Escherichia coli]